MRAARRSFALIDAHLKQAGRAQQRRYSFLIAAPSNKPTGRFPSNAGFFVAGSGAWAAAATAAAEGS